MTAVYTGRMAKPLLNSCRLVHTSFCYGYDLLVQQLQVAGSAVLRVVSFKHKNTSSTPNTSSYRFPVRVPNICQIEVRSVGSKDR